ncbi:MAG: ABA4-like family protein [Pseudohongiellaceae bacterium]
MSADAIFSLCSSLIIPGWLLLIVLPRWKWTLGLIATGIIPFMLAIVYGGLFMFGGETAEGGGFGSLEGVTILFSNPYSMTAGWIHYLAFDLFVGAWEVKDSQDKKIPHWMVIPCLGLTLMLGPIGLALYLIIRTVRTKSVLIYV